MFERLIDRTDFRNNSFFKLSVMNKIQRRVPKADNANRKAPPGGHRPGLWTECFNMVVSPSVDSYWADCLRYMCSIERRSQFKTSSKVHASSNTNGSGSVAVVVAPPHLPLTMMSPVRASHKPHAVLSFITWDQRHRDLRGLVAQALQANNHFADGHVLNAIEADASEEMGEPLLWYPVAHVTRDFRLSMYSKEKKHDKKTLGSNFTLLQDYYYEHAKLTLILDKGGGELGRLSPHPERNTGEGKLRNQLVLAYKSLEDSTDPQLLAGWVRWSGAWEAYTYLQEKKLPVSTITLYVRERGSVRLKRPKESFKYVVMLEVVTTSADELQQLRAATQRLRVERWSGYICVYTVHSLEDFADNFNSSDSITKMVGDIM